MLRRISIIILWALGVLIASQMLLGFLSGLVFFGLAMLSSDSSISDTVATWIGRIVITLSVGLTVATVIIGIKGQLPGARTVPPDTAV